MKWMSRRVLVGVITGILGSLLLVPSISAGSKNEEYRYFDLTALFCAPVARLHSQQVTGGQSKQAALKDAEIPTPFKVREMKGTIYSTERKPLQGADFSIRLENGVELIAPTDSDGSFKFVFPHDPLGGLLHPHLHRIIRGSAVRPGTYRFKATKDGFHSAVGTVVVSPDAPKESSIEVQLQPESFTRQEGSGSGAVVVSPIAPKESASKVQPQPESPKQHKYGYSEIDMPISLGVGTVRTPEFPVIHEAYFIMIQAEKRLPYVDMKCMMGLTAGPTEGSECNKEPVLKAYWTVLDGEHIVAQGSNRTEADAEYTNEYMFKFLGSFMGKSGKKYVVEVKFTKDGTPLNVTNPHLIVILVRNH